MGTKVSFLRAAIGIVALLCATVVPSSTEAQSQIQGGREQRIEIVIEDRAFFLAKGGLLQVGTPLEIVVENRDQVRHGFTSPMLLGILVFGEDDQIVTYGKGVEGFYVNPGKTLVIRFTTDRPGSFPFHCDLHERMKGELYVLEFVTMMDRRSTRSGAKPAVDDSARWRMTEAVEYGDIQRNDGIGRGAQGVTVVGKAWLSSSVRKNRSHVVVRTLSG